MDFIILLLFFIIFLKFYDKHIRLMKSLIFLIFFIGALFIAVGYCKHRVDKTPPIIEYRYIPKSFTLEQLERTPARALFGRMFNDNDPWIKSVGFASNDNRRKLFTYHDAY